MVAHAQDSRYAVPPLTDGARRSPVLTLAERVLGIDSTGKRQLFPTYTELPTKIPLRVWQAIRVASIAGYFGLIAMMFVQPAAGLFVFFRVIVPLFPLLVFVAPGVWRVVWPGRQRRRDGGRARCGRRGGLRRRCRIQGEEWLV